MVQTGMTTLYTAFAQQNGSAGDHIKSDMKSMEGTPPGGGAGGGTPNGHLEHHQNVNGDDGSQDVATSLAAAERLSQSSGDSNSGSQDNTPKRLHVSNIPFRFRDPDLRNMFGVRLWTPKSQFSSGAS